jgi:hypothetical protein
LLTTCSGPQERIQQQGSSPLSVISSSRHLIISSSRKMPKKSKFFFADVRKALAARLAGSAEQREFLWAHGWKAWHKKFNFDIEGERTDGGVFPLKMPAGNWSTAPLGDGKCLWKGVAHFVGKDPEDPLPGVDPPQRRVPSRSSPMYFSEKLGSSGSSSSPRIWPEAPAVSKEELERARASGGARCRRERLAQCVVRVGGAKWSQERDDELHAWAAGAVERCAGGDPRPLAGTGMGGVAGGPLRSDRALQQLVRLSSACARLAVAVGDEEAEMVGAARALDALATAALHRRRKALAGPRVPGEGGEAGAGGASPDAPSRARDDGAIDDASAVEAAAALEEAVVVGAEEDARAAAEQEWAAQAAAAGGGAGR